MMQDLNQAVQEEFHEVHYATMVAVGWHGRRGLLVLTNAGHPTPLWHRAVRRNGAGSKRSAGAREGGRAGFR